MDPRRTAAGRRKECARIGQAVDDRCCQEGKSEASLNGSIPGWKKGALGKKNWWGHYNRRWQWEVNALDLLLTAQECTKELMLHCAVKLANIWIPIQVCCSFQTRDFLQQLATRIAPNLRNHKQKIDWTTDHVNSTPTLPKMVYILSIHFFKFFLILWLSLH